MNVTKRLFSVVTAIFMLAAAAPSWAQVLSENWNDGDIGSDWQVQGHTPFGDPALDARAELVEVSTGDFALFLANGPSDWQVKALSAQSFPRGDNTRVTFSFWGDDQTLFGAGGQVFPGAAAISGPWQTTGDIAGGGSFSETIDAGVDFWWNALAWEESGGATGHGWDPDSKNPTLSDLFMASYGNARSKETRMIIRVWLGNEKGAAMDFSFDQGETFTAAATALDGTVIDTRGMDEHNLTPNGAVPTGTTSPLWVGWSPLTSGIFIDDIKIETDSNNDGQDPPFGGDGGAGGAGLPWTESWDSLDLDTTKWTTAGHNPPMFHMAPIDPGDGDLAFLMGNMALDWSTKLRSKDSWPRGENLRCTFDLFGLDDSARLGMDFAHQYPGASGFHGPFHSTPIIGENIYATIDAGMDFWWNIIGFEEGGQATGLQTANFSIDDAFHAAMHPAGRDPEEAVGRDTGIKMRFWAGDVSGFFMEWSLDGGVTWTPGATWPDSDVYDTRGQDMMTRPDDEVVPTGNATPLYLGFSTAQGGVFIDNIIIENDSHPFMQGTPTPTPTPAPNEVGHWTFY